MTATSRSTAPGRQPSPPQRRSRIAQILACRSLAALAGDRSGASAIIIGLASMVLLGFTALGTEAGYWYFTHRDLQNAADSAAMSAAAALTNVTTPGTTDKTQATAEAKATAARYGFTDTQGGVAVAVNIPPAAGAYTSEANAVEVVITEPQTLFLTAAMSFGGTPLFAAPPTQKVRAVAHPKTNGNGCVVTLDKSAVIDLSLNGNTSVNLTGCDLYVNSNATNALSQVGSAAITARAAFIYGGDTGNGNITTQVGPNCTTAPCAPYFGTLPINDPYAGIAPPYTSPGSSCSNASPPTSTHVNTSTSGGVTTFTPDGTNMAVFCGGWDPSAGNTSNIFLNPGLYVVDGGIFGCNNCTISGSNVTIYLTGSGTTYAGMSFSGNGTAWLNINAPTAAFMAANNATKAIMGIAIFGDRNDPCPLVNGVRTCRVSSTFSANATPTINGVIYLPDQNSTFNGNGAAGSPVCAQFISYTITFHGNSGFANNCTDYSNNNTGTGVLNIGAIPAQLVE